MIDIKEHVRQEFIEAFGEEKGAYWYDSLVEASDNLTRCRERAEALEEWVARVARLDPTRGPMDLRGVVADAKALLTAGEPA